MVRQPDDRAPAAARLSRNAPATRTHASVIAWCALVAASGATAQAQGIAEVMASAKRVGEVVIFANDYVRVSYDVFEYPPADRRTAERRPVVLYVSVTPGPGILNAELLLPPPRTLRSQQPVPAPRGVRIEVLKSPPPPPALGDPGTDLPYGATEAAQWKGGRLILATFESMHMAEGLGRFPSVTTFLSGGIIDIAHGGVRRRVGVGAGDAFWFDATTRLSVFTDDPVGVAIVQLYPDR